MKLYETINATNWTQEAFAKDRRGHAIGSNHPWAQRWCLAGHLRRIGARRKTRLRVHLAIQSLFPERTTAAPVWGIYNFNDCRKTTVEDVIRVCKVADV